MAKMTDAQKLEKVIKKLQAVVAELQALRHEPLWHSQRRELRKVVFDIEDHMASIIPLWEEETSNR